MRSVMLAATLVTLAVPAVAANYYVSPTGLDSATGSISAPWKTIRKAAAVAVAGDTVTVASGTYAGAITQSANGSDAAPIVFQGSGATKPRIVPAAGDGGNAVWIAGTNVAWRGFEIDGTGSTLWNIGVYATGSYDVVDGNLIHGMADPSCLGQGAGGVVSDHFYGGTRINIVGNEVHHVGPATACNTDAGIYPQTSGVVANNKSHNNAGWGIVTYHDATDVAIVGNETYANGSQSGGIAVGCGGFYTLTACDNFHVVGNNVHDEPYIGLLGTTADWIYQGHHSWMVNNTLARNLYACVGLDLINTEYQVCPSAP